MAHWARRLPEFGSHNSFISRCEDLDNRIAYLSGLLAESQLMREQAEAAALVHIRQHWTDEEINKAKEGV